MVVVVVVLPVVAIYQRSKILERWGEASSTKRSTMRSSMYQSIDIEYHTKHVRQPRVLSEWRQGKSVITLWCLLGVEGWVVWFLILRFWMYVENETVRVNKNRNFLPRNPMSAYRLTETHGPILTTWLDKLRQPVTLNFRAVIKESRSDFKLFYFEGFTRR